jgi:hypothetical protein
LSLYLDLFESPENALLLLDPILATLEGKVIYEPCSGDGAIVRFLERRGFTVIARDLYTTEVKQDYLLEEDPEYDVLIINPRTYNLFDVFDSPHLVFIRRFIVLS